MLEKGKVSNRQLMLLLSFTIVMATSVLFVPAIVAEHAGHNGWLSVLVVASTYGLVVALVVIKLGNRFPDQTIIEYAPVILGPFLGKLVAAAYVLWFVHLTAIIVREFGDFMLSAFMPETPLIVFNLMLLLLGVWAVKSGLEVICRANEWIMPIFFTSFGLIILMVMPEADYTNILPVLDEGIKPVLRGSLTPMAWRGEIVLVLMFFPALNNPRHGGKYLVASVLVMGGILAAVTLASVAVLGDITQYMVFPFHTLSRYISISGVLERMEVLTLVMWVAGETIKVAAFYFSGTLGVAQLFGLKSYQPVVLPLGVIIAAWSISLFSNSRELVDWLSNIFPYYSYSFELVIPGMLLLVAMARKQGGTGRD